VKRRVGRSLTRDGAACPNLSVSTATMPNDIPTFAAVTVLFSAVVFACTCIQARRAAKSDSSVAPVMTELDQQYGAS
jgi:hypothetical protein